VGLQGVLNDIKSNRKSSVYSVTKFNSDKVFVGLDHDDRPCVFISVSSIEQFPSIKTTQIKVEFSKKYSLLLSGSQKKDGIFHGIFCLSKEKIDINTFISVMEYVLLELGDNVSVESMNSIFRSLVNLFSIKPSQDYITERRGLWAELYFMKHYTGFNFWIPSWHSEPTRLFDFSRQRKRIEIKSTIRSERIHEFSHGQLLAPPSEKILIVSFMLQEDDSGLSLKSLVEQARTTLVGTPHILKLQKAIRVANMLETEEEGPKFNESYTIRKIGWFDSKDVPKFPILEPQGVSGTHYKSDLTHATSLSSDEVGTCIHDWNLLE